MYLPLVYVYSLWSPVIPLLERQMLEIFGIKTFSIKNSKTFGSYMTDKDWLKV